MDLFRFPRFSVSGKKDVVINVEDKQFEFSVPWYISVTRETAVLVVGYLPDECKTDLSVQELKTIIDGDETQIDNECKYMILQTVFSKLKKTAYAKEKATA